VRECSWERRYPFSAPDKTQESNTPLRSGGGGGGGDCDLGANRGVGAGFWDLLGWVIDGPCPSKELAELVEVAAVAEATCHSEINRDDEAAAATATADLVRKCLNRDPARRPPARRCLRHPFLTGAAATRRSDGCENEGGGGSGAAALVAWLEWALGGCGGGEELHFTLLPALRCKTRDSAAAAAAATGPACDAGALALAAAAGPAAASCLGFTPSGCRR
jgi:hypothetical protein